jgi:hypothetical protein
MEKRIYNHRLPADLAALETDLQSLTRIQKASAALLAIEAELFRPLWPVRLAYAVACRIYGCANATGRIATGMSKQFPGSVDGLWRDLMRHMKEGRNSDDATSAGGWNYRDLRMFLYIVETLGWTPPAERAAPDIQEPAQPATRLADTASPARS